MFSAALIRRPSIIARATILLFVSVAAGAQTFDSSAFAGMRWREIGPYRGGRSVAVAGSTKRPSNTGWARPAAECSRPIDGGMTLDPDD